ESWGHAPRARNRGAQSGPLAVIPDSRCQTAQFSSFPRRVAAPGFLRPFACAFAFASGGEPTRHWRRQPSRQQQFRPPDEGWMERRQAHSFFRSRLRRATPCPGATGTPLGAPPWRFSDADPRSRLPAVGPEPQRLPAPSIKARRSGSGPPSVRFRAAVEGRHSPLRLQVRLRRRPLMSEDDDSYISTSICSQVINSYRSRISTGTASGLGAASGLETVVLFHQSRRRSSAPSHRAHEGKLRSREGRT
ncbi:MAG: hypothetical protein QOK01_1243, partial [Alphaproteobacteria bacterium]|nr:hypothetical protein [Alphaproteobacteria bacterium]